MKAAEAEREDENEKLEKAAAAITNPKEEKEQNEKKEQNEGSIVDAISNTMGETLEEVVDTAKAVAIVMGDKINEAVKNFVDNDDEDKADEVKSEEE